MQKLWPVALFTAVIGHNVHISFAKTRLLRHSSALLNSGLQLT
jgi:hypothetical protein